jgi:teichuronic acid biosynthesis glycosyltransferase TuaG
VIVPAHNAAPYLPEAIASVQLQTFQDWELVVVDDGSSDDTWRLLQAYDPPVHSFHRASPGGPALARNHAIAHASGDLVAFLDADDLLLPGYLHSQLAAYELACRRYGQEAVGLVGCDARILIGERYAPYTHLQRVPGGPGPLTLERVLRRNPIYVSCLVPRAVGEAVGWFDPELFGTEDFGLWIKILEAGYRGVLNDEVLAVYRRGAGSLSSDLASQAVNNRRAYELALVRGRLSARQRKIALSAIRYNLAMEHVALLRFGGPNGRKQRARSLLRLPLLARVALSNPRLWPQWLGLLARGRTPESGPLRAAR